MREVILALDAGGTSIKAGILRDEEIIAERSFAFLSEEREQMLSVFRQALAWGRDYGPICLGVACPGPFDFARGVSHMRHKWRGLMDVPLPSVFARELPGVPVRFLHDSTAFLLGEAWQGAARDMENPAGVMLGTGFGFTVMQRRRVLVDATVPRRWCCGTLPSGMVRWRTTSADAPWRDAYGPQAPDVRSWRSWRAGRHAGAGDFPPAWGKLWAKCSPATSPPGRMAWCWAGRLPARQSFSSPGPRYRRP